MGAWYCIEEESPVTLLNDEMYFHEFAVSWVEYCMLYRRLVLLPHRIIILVSDEGIINILGRGPTIYSVIDVTEPPYVRSFMITCAQNTSGWNPDLAPICISDSHGVATGMWLPSGSNEHSNLMV
jgi:hypothetical protein